MSEKQIYKQFQAVKVNLINLFVHSKYNAQ